MPSVAARIAAYEKKFHPDGAAIVHNNNNNTNTTKPTVNTKPIVSHTTKPIVNVSRRPTFSFGDKKPLLPPRGVVPASSAAQPGGGRLRSADDVSTKTSSTSTSSASALSVHTKIDNPSANQDFEVQLHLTDEAAARDLEEEDDARHHHQELLGTHVAFSEGGECNFSTCSQSQADDDEIHGHQENGEAALMAAIAVATSNQQLVVAGGSSKPATSPDQDMIVYNCTDATTTRFEAEEMYMSIDNHLDSILMSQTIDYGQDRQDRLCRLESTVHRNCRDDAGLLDEIERILFFTDVVDRKPPPHDAQSTAVFAPLTGAALTASKVLAPLWTIPQAVGSTLYNSSVEAYQEVEKTCKEVERVVLFTDVPDGPEPDKKPLNSNNNKNKNQSSYNMFASLEKVATLSSTVSGSTSMADAFENAAQSQVSLQQFTQMLQALEQTLKFTTTSNGKEAVVPAQQQQQSPPSQISQMLQSLEQTLLFTDLPDAPPNTSQRPSHNHAEPVASVPRPSPPPPTATPAGGEASSSSSPFVFPSVTMPQGEIARVLQKLEQTLFFTDILPDQPRPTSPNQHLNNNNNSHSTPTPHQAPKSTTTTTTTTTTAQEVLVQVPTTRPLAANDSERPTNAVATLSTRIQSRATPPQDDDKATAILKTQELMEQARPGGELNEKTLVVQHCIAADAATVVKALATSQVTAEQAVMKNNDEETPASGKTYVVALVVSEKVESTIRSTVKGEDGLPGAKDNSETLVQGESAAGGAFDKKKRAAHVGSHPLKKGIGSTVFSDEMSDVEVRFLTTVKVTESISNVTSDIAGDDEAPLHDAVDSPLEEQDATRQGTWTTQDEHVLENIMVSLKSDTIASNHAGDEEASQTGTKGPCSVVEVPQGTEDGSTWCDTSFVTALDNDGAGSTNEPNRNMGQDAGDDGLEWNKSSASNAATSIAPLVPKLTADTGAFDALLAQMEQLETSIDCDLARAQTVLRSSPARNHIIREGKGQGEAVGSCPG